MQSKIDYKDVVELGFSVEEDVDDVFMSINGYEYKIVELNLSKTFYIDWDIETRLCTLCRCDKKGYIKARHKIRNLEELRYWINFFGKKVDGYEETDSPSFPIEIDFSHCG